MQAERRVPFLLKHLIFVAALADLSLSCQSSVTGNNIPAEGDDRLNVGGEVEIFSWWTSGGEKEALSSLIDVHEERVPNAHVTNAAVENADKAREELSRRLQAGIPPDTFQANSGTDLLDWVVANGRDDGDSKVESLKELAEDLSWERSFDADVLESVSFDGKVYAVPLNVHRVNTLFYRIDLFERFDLKVPETIEELNSLCRKIREDEEIQNSNSDGVACLGLGNKWNWTFSLLIFDILVPAMAGPRYYENYFSGKESALSSKMRDVLNQALLMYCGDGDRSNCEATGWFNSDVDERTWDEGIQKLSDGKALMAPMGDWAKGYLESPAGNNLKAGKDFGVVPFPGSKGTFVFAADTFPLPRGAPNRDGARSLLKTFASKKGQIEFSRLKGSIPARIDIDPQEFDDVSRQTIAAFQSATKVRAISGLLSGGSREALSRELGASLEEGNMGLMRRFLEANYPLH